MKPKTADSRERSVEVHAVADLGPTPCRAVHLTNLRGVNPRPTEFLDLWETRLGQCLWSDARWPTPPLPNGHCIAEQEMFSKTWSKLGLSTGFALALCWLCAELPAYHCKNSKKNYTSKCGKLLHIFLMFLQVSCSYCWMVRASPQWGCVMTSCSALKFCWGRQ